MEHKRLSTLLKLIAHPERMNILLLLLEGDRSIHELAAATALPATVISNHLAKMRSENVVDYTRYHRILEYRLISEETIAILRTIQNLQNNTRQAA